MSIPGSMKRPAASLEDLARKQFTPEGKAERISRALAALNQEQSIKLTAAEWRWVAEDVDFEDQP